MGKRNRWFDPWSIKFEWTLDSGSKREPNLGSWTHVRDMWRAIWESRFFEWDFYFYLSFSIFLKLKGLSKGEKIFSSDVQFYKRAERLYVLHRMIFEVFFYAKRVIKHGRYRVGNEYSVKYIWQFLIDSNVYVAMFDETMLL